MSFKKLVEKRFSVRAYNPEQLVDRATLDDIFDTVRLAPSARNLQPWQFTVAESVSARTAIAEAFGRDWLLSAPVIVVVKGDKSQARVREFDGYSTFEADLAIGFTHLLLAAADKGLGTCWIANFNPEILRKALSLPENEFVLGITPLGYAAEGQRPSEPRPRKTLAEIVSYI